MTDEKKTTITLAGSEHVDFFKREVGEILEAIGFAGALVTDESMLKDFDVGPAFGEKSRNLEGIIFEKFGVRSTRKSLLWEIALDLNRAREKTIH